MPQSLEPEERRDHKPNSSRAASEWARAKVQQIARRASQPGQPLSSNAWMGVRANVEEREKPQTRDDDPMAESTSSRFRDQENSIWSEPPDLDNLFASFSSHKEVQRAASGSRVRGSFCAIRRGPQARHGRAVERGRPFRVARPRSRHRNARSPPRTSKLRQRPEG